MSDTPESDALITELNIEQDWRMCYSRAITKAIELERRLTAARLAISRYARHDTECAIFHSAYGKCDCGLFDMLGVDCWSKI